MPRPRITGDVETYTLRGLGPLPTAGRRDDVLIEGRIGRLPTRYAIPDSARRTLRQNQIFAERERATAAGLVVQPKVQTAFKPPAGKLWDMNMGALLVVGPKGAIGVTPAIARLLIPLAVGGRHDEAGIAAATGCRDTGHLRELLAGISGKLSAVGLRIDRRKTGVRIAKARP